MPYGSLFLQIPFVLLWEGLGGGERKALHAKQVGHSYNSWQTAQSFSEEEQGALYQSPH